MDGQPGGGQQARDLYPPEILDDLIPRSPPGNVAFPDATMMSDITPG
ncbi:MAG TPA: hypothetical protein PLN56_00015 [Methanoregulaceae archaeon]|nr:MAG: hypothetical protein IPI71_05600 [Methanolinea sp.]HON80638.1 hypothetical protein [Methanoregulaceae archaeon]HPD09372.1 hypothetical protein [Methanoregulaceae archaeon]HRT14835.1 hypothetical protein [Methanoregulaceae archaeon]HRU30408.1 hypothetical protein [Methanoregulaceae archaeon]